MIVGVHGTLEITGPDWVHVRVGGVTLQVFVPANTVSGLGAIGSQVTLHTHLRIRDDEPVLFGFIDAAALGLFSMLTAVSGVGPRTALALLSSLGDVTHLHSKYLPLISLFMGAVPKAVGVKTQSLL